MIRVMVITASKHGATHEIGDAIASALGAEGIEAVVLPAQDVTAIDNTDAVIMGSGEIAASLAPAKARNR